MKQIVIVLSVIFGLFLISHAAVLTPKAFLKLPFSAPGARFGSAVAMNAQATEVVVGAPKFNATGIVDTFSRINYLWSHDTVLFPPFSGASVNTPPLFGNSVDLYSYIDSNNTANTYHLLAVGAPGLGAVYIYVSAYTNTTNSFSWMLLQNITNPQNSLDWGRRLSFAPNSPLLLIGGDQSAQIYTCNQTACTLSSILQPPSISPLPIFGERVLLSNNFAFIGAYQAVNDSGIVLVYPLSNNLGTPTNPTVLTVSQTLSPTSTTSGAEFGKALCFSGSNFVVGAPHEAIKGVVYWFYLNSTSSSFQFVAKINPPSTYPLLGFGDSLSIDDIELVIGADSSGQGAAFNYHFPSTLTSTFDDPDSLLPPNNDPLNTGFASTIANRGLGAFILGFNGDSTGSTGVINQQNAAGSGSGASPQSGAAYIVVEDCNLNVSVIANSSAYGVPLTKCNPSDQNMAHDYSLSVVEDAIIPAGVTLTLPMFAKNVTFNKNLTFTNGTVILMNNVPVYGGNLSVTAGTQITVKGRLSLANATIVFNTQQTGVYKPGSASLEIPLFVEVDNSDAWTASQVTLILVADPPALSCQRFDTSLSATGKGGLNVKIRLNEDQCDLLAAEETSLVAAVLVVVIGLPCLIACALVSQYYLSMMSGDDAD